MQPFIAVLIHETSMHNLKTKELVSILDYKDDDGET